MEFEVEKIISKRLKNARIQYRLKWVGFSSKFNSWIDLENINCPELIDDFEKKNVIGIISEFYNI